MPKVEITDDAEVIIEPQNTVLVDMLTGPPGPVFGTLPDYVKRAFRFPTAQPSLPQAFSMEYKDANGAWWDASAGDTVWTLRNTVIPGGV